MALGVAFTFWLFYSYQAKGVNEKLLQNSRSVKVDITSDFYYSFQLGDSKADISRENQQAETLKNILEFVKD